MCSNGSSTRLVQRRFLKRQSVTWGLAVVLLLPGTRIGAQFATSGESFTADPAATTRPPHLALLTDYRQIRQVVQQLPPSELESLQKKRDRFAAESPETRQRMRDFHKALANDADSERLFTVMSKYYQWLGRLPASERAALVDLPPGERIERIHELKKRQNHEWLRRVTDGITPEDALAVREFFTSYLESNDAELMAQLSSPNREAIQKTRNPRRQRMMLVSALLRGNIRSLPTPDAKMIEQLESRLSEEARQLWKKATIDNERQELLQGWMRAIFRSRMPHVSDDELERFYLTRLSPDQRDELNQLPPRQLRERLRYLYYRRQGWRGNGRDKSDVPHLKLR